MLIRLDSAADDRLADYVRLRETSLRRSLEAEHGLFIAEGEKVIIRAVAAGYEPRSFLLAERWLAGLSGVLARWPSAPVYVVDEDLAEQITGFHVHRGALASLRRRVSHTVEELLELERLVVLEDIVDHTNVGAIIRNAAGLGWDGALVSAQTADPLYRRSIKVSMGAVFSLPWARLPQRADPRLLRSAGFVTIALTPDASAVDLGEAADDLRATRIAMLLGSEGPGLTPGWLESADVRVRIPMHAGIDSLNVAAAAAIVCHALGPSSTFGSTGHSAG